MFVGRAEELDLVHGKILPRGWRNRLGVGRCWFGSAFVALAVAAATAALWLWRRRPGAITNHEAKALIRWHDDSAVRVMRLGDSTDAPLVVRDADGADVDRAASFWRSHESKRKCAKCPKGQRATKDASHLLDFNLQFAICILHFAILHFEDALGQFNKKTPRRFRPQGWCVSCVSPNRPLRPFVGNANGDADDDTGPIGRFC